MNLVKKIELLFTLYFLFICCGIITTVSAVDGTITVGETFDISRTDPAMVGTLFAEKAVIIEPLTGVAEDFSIIPCLATDWEQVDQNTWKFTLREGVQFHDGTPLSANAVKFSLDRATDVNPSNKELLNYDSTEVVDDKTILIKTTEPMPSLPAFVHYSNLGIISPSSIDSSGELTSIVGTGPMKYQSFNEQTKTLTMTANENYWRTAPGFKTLVIRSIPDPNTRALAIETGEVDFTVDLPFSETETIDAIDGINVEKYSVPRLYHMDLNHNHDIIEDKNLRQAIAYGIDADSIVTNLLYGVGDKAVGPFLPIMKWADSNLIGYSYDQNKAMALLDEAGWVDSDNDGVRDKDGKKLELKLITFTSRPGLPPMAEAIAGQLAEVGIKVTTEATEYGAFSDTHDSGDWDLSLTTSSMSMVPDPAYALSGWYSTGGNLNGGFYSNPELDKMISNANSASDESARYAGFNEVQEYVMDELPMIPVAYYGISIAKKDGISGYKFDPTAHDYKIDPEMKIN